MNEFNLIYQSINSNMVYDNKHKIVLQTIIHKGALSENEGKELIIKLFGI